MIRPLEVQLLVFLKKYAHRKLLLATSGGLDSMAQLKLFEQLAPKIPLTFAVVHIHHGKSAQPLQTKFRHQAFEFVKSYCGERQIPFFSNVQDLKEGSLRLVDASSEHALRHFRQQNIKKIAHDWGSDAVVLAHQAEDLFETRLLRLIRGTGPQGLRAMSASQKGVLRPLLKTSKKQLEEYLFSFPQTTTAPLFVTDPSNESSQYLRNWLRNEWLPTLEERRPGAVRCFAQSLESLLEATEQVPSLNSCFDEHGLLRSEYLTLSLTDKRRVWALYLKRMGVKNYGLSHINELVKRLDVEQKELTFTLLKKRWLANARHIWCESKNAIE